MIANMFKMLSIELSNRDGACHGPIIPPNHFRSTREPVVNNAPHQAFTNGTRQAASANATLSAKGF